MEGVSIEAVFDPNGLARMREAPGSYQKTQSKPRMC